MTDAPDGLGPAELRSRYGLAAISPTEGQGQRIFLLSEAYSAADTESDLAVYRQRFGLGDCTVADGCLQLLAADGTGAPTASKPLWQDLLASVAAETVSAICPRCGITVIFGAAAEEPKGFTKSIVTARRLGAKFVVQTGTLTVNQLRSPGETTFEARQRLDVLLGPGVFWAASDLNSGKPSTTLAGPGPMSWPNGSHWSVAVGATTDINGAEEASTMSAAVGCAGYHYAAVFADDARVTKCPDGTRGYNDVAAVGWDVAFYAAREDGWSVTGTGAEYDVVPASIVAATAALAGAPSSTSVPARYLWQNWKNNPSVLTDITEGGASDAEDCPHYLCMAEVGWDGVTGLGVPNGVAAFRPPIIAPVAQSYRFQLGSGPAARCMGVASEAVRPAPVTVAPCGQGDRDENWRVLRSKTPSHRLAYTLINSGGGCLTLAEGAAATVTNCAELGRRFTPQEIRFLFAHRLGRSWPDGTINTIYARTDGSLWLTKSPPMGPLDAWTLVKAA